MNHFRFLVSVCVSVSVFWYVLWNDMIVDILYHIIDDCGCTVSYNR